MYLLSRGHLIGALLGCIAYFTYVQIYRHAVPYTDSHLDSKALSRLNRKDASKGDHRNAHKPDRFGHRNSSTAFRFDGRPQSDSPSKITNSHQVSQNSNIQTSNHDNLHQSKVSNSNIETSNPSLNLKPSPGKGDEATLANTCSDMKKNYHVEPGSSWGSLPTELQREWTRLTCDKYVNAESPSESVSPETLSPDTTTPSDASEVVSFAKKSGVGLMKIKQDYADWCIEAKERYQVQPMKSWGRLPGNMIDLWKNRRCDMVFTVHRMSKRRISTCLSNDSDIYSKTKKGIYYSGKETHFHPNMNQSLPLIAIMAATTTRGVKKPSPTNMALFLYLLPSLIRSLDCGFRYEYVLGYDVGDPFYDTKEGMDTTKTWFTENVEEPLKANAIQMKLRPVKVNNSAKKPGPVFLEMARAAYRDGAMYFYRINDDTEILTNWPKVFVKAIHSLSYPYGVVGPICRQGNNQILTHDFVHREHMEIFEMNYYPPELTDWWMDDWISFVYGDKRTFKANRTPVLHHTGVHGQRYEVDRSHERLLDNLLTSGHSKIRSYMLKKNVPEHIIKEFDMSEYKRFIHKDVPSQSYSA